ncbi:TetR/AcrR family transcriptional regulator [Caulobacter sp.]|uniref:TetR/AcrR family transcriptional regulator n=1 Tax=Caulobacter sp. TaxID=78 RepID=UPI002B45A0AB|nr:TetR/AcrR family transcriptional regulator [Caulobacter sp.]HJV40146.1 TetR/AcrR family transcriptional regulator [Caulobacter sp.]
MTTATVESRPYHHGDLSRALVDAARKILETEGPGALSLRAVAREAGVSPAAPYHHFKDKNELLEAVAHEGWVELDQALSNARASTENPRTRMTNLGVAYVRFARDNPALYRVMYDRSRDKDALPDQLKDDGAYCQVRNTLAEHTGAHVAEIDLELATIAAWCAGHGLAEMISFKQFAPLKEMLGGEEAFLRAVFEHLGMFAKFTTQD